MTYQLSTTFNGIDDKQIDARIDRLHTEIVKGLHTLAGQTTAEKAHAGAITAFYTDNTVKLVLEAAGNAYAFDRAVIEAAIPVPAPEKVKGYPINQTLQDAMDSRPGWTLGGFFSGTIRASKTSFIESLKTTGEALINQAETVYNTAVSTREAAAQNGWDILGAASNFHNDISIALTAPLQAEPRLDDVLAVLQSDNAQTVPSAQRAALLKAPLAGHATGLLAIAALAHEVQPAKEGEAVARALASLGDDFAAMALLGASVKALEEGETKTRFGKYLEALSGQFIQPFSNVIVNVNAIGNVGHYQRGNGQDYISFTSAAGKTLTSGDMSRNRAQAIVDALSARPNFIKPFSNVAVNVNGIANAGVYNRGDGKTYLSITSAGGKTLTSGDMSRETAQALFDELATRPNFIRVFANNVVNVNTIANAALYKRGDGQTYLSLTSAAGKTISSGDATPEEAQAIFDQLLALPQFMQVFSNNVVNANTIANAGIYTRGDGQTYLSITSAGGKTISSGNMEESEARVILDALSARPNFIPAHSNNVVNVNTIADAAVYTRGDGKTTYLSICSAAGKTISSGDMDREKAQGIVDALATRPNFIKAFDNVAVNVNMVADAAVQSRGDGQTTLGIYSAAGKTITSGVMEREKAQGIVDALAKRPGFIHAFDTVAVNTMMVADASVQSRGDGQTTLGIYSAAGKTITSGHMAHDNAHAKLAAIREMGADRSLKKLAGNAAVYGAALEAMQATQDASVQAATASSSRNDDSLMDYLPLIAVAYIVLSDHDTAAAHDGSGLDDDGADHAAGADGADGSALGNEFGDAADGVEIDTPDTDFDYGADMDFTDMNDVMDMDMGTSDFGGGMDYNNY